MPQKSFEQGRLRHILPFARKVKTALSLPWDNPNKHQRDELDDNAGLPIVHQKPISTIEAGQQQSLVGNFLHCGCYSFKVPQSSCCFRKNPLVITSIHIFNIFVFFFGHTIVNFYLFIFQYFAITAQPPRNMLAKWLKHTTAARG